jgi:hypothetical protein
MNVNNEDVNHASHASHEPERASDLYFSTTVRPRITMLLRGHVAGIECNVTLDTAATSTFMSSDLARQCGIAVEAVDLPTYGPDDTTLNCSWHGYGSTYFGSVKISIRAIVADLQGQLATPMSFYYLGDEFLLQTRAILDDNDQSVTLRIETDSHTFHLGNPDVSRVLGKPLSLSAMMAS